MNQQIVIRHPHGSRIAGERDFPLSIGGPDGGLPLPGIGTERTLAYLGLDDGTLFIQPSGDGDTVRWNGTPITTSTWLYPGDTIDIENVRITIQSDDESIQVVCVPMSDTPTEPPESPAPPRSQRSTAESAGPVTPVEFTPAGGPPRRPPRWRPHPVTVALILFLLSAAAILWYVVTARAVTIEISPEPESAVLTGGMVHPEIGGRFLLRPGAYRLAAEHPDYRRLDTELTVTEASNQVFRFVLVPRPGILALTVIPPVVAVVEVDGQLVGQTPLEGVELELGVHEIVVRADRHQVVATTVTIDEPGVLHDLSVELVPAWAAVTIRSEPAGAEVIVDGAAVGTTPMAIDLGAGAHRFALRLGGFKPHQETIDVVANQPIVLPVKRLVPADGTLAVTSRPSGAVLTVDGIFAGQTPMQLSLTPEVDHHITVSKTGHQTHTAKLRLEAGASDSLTVDLVALFGEVQILSTPAGAEILVDGVPREQTPATLRLSALGHTLELRKDGYTPYTMTVLPEVGLLETIRATLEPVDNRPAKPVTSITTSQGARMERIPAGRVLMGASRREPGRRANESIRNAEITRPFFLAVHEVTNGQYRQFSSGHSSGQAGGVSLREDDRPVVGVTWEDAVRYCNWLSEREGLPPVYVEQEDSFIARTPLPDGYRLPTEAEWALAARMAGGGNPRKYVWGDQLPPPKGAGNYGDASAKRILGDSLPDYSDGFPATAPVGSFDPNPRGIFDLGGNVTEWVHDAYTIYPPDSKDIERDPVGPPQGEYHVIRGAGWMDTKLTRLRLSYRDYGDDPAPDLGFRIARNAD